MGTPAVFNNLDLMCAYITLNGEKYPREDVVSNFAKINYTRLYTMFGDFKKGFYGELIGGTQVDFPAFKSLFLTLVFDLTKQSDIVMISAIDMRVTLNYAVAPANTATYALINFR